MCTKIEKQAWLVFFSFLDGWDSQLHDLYRNGLFEMLKESDPNWPKKYKEWKKMNVAGSS